MFAAVAIAAGWFSALAHSLGVLAAAFILLVEFRPAFAWTAAFAWVVAALARAAGSLTRESRGDALVIAVVAASLVELGRVTAAVLVLAAMRAVLTVNEAAWPAALFAAALTTSLFGHAVDVARAASIAEHARWPQLAGALSAALRPGIVLIGVVASALSLAGTLLMALGLVLLVTGAPIPALLSFAGALVVARLERSVRTAAIARVKTPATAG